MRQVSVHGKESKRPDLGTKIIKKSPLFNFCRVDLIIYPANSPVFSFNI